MGEDIGSAPGVSLKASRSVWFIGVLGMLFFGLPLLMNRIGNMKGGSWRS
jgi:hypothetical protein